MNKNKIAYSEVIAGAMTWGTWGKNFSSSEMKNLIEFCANNGITTFDHADIYGGYSTEAAFGNALAATSLKRESIQLITKCGIQMVDDARNNKVKHYNYSKEYIIWSAEQSLKHLKTEYIDLFLLHRPSPLMQPEEIAAAVTKLLEQGKIKSFGVSNFKPAQIALLETNIPVLGNQLEFSLTSNEAMINGDLDEGLANNRMMMSWSPLGSYFKNSDEQTNRISKILKPLCDKYNATEDQLLLAWIMKHPSKIYPVVGTSSEKRLKTSLEATKIDLELEDWFLLLQASNGEEVA